MTDPEKLFVDNVEIDGAIYPVWYYLHSRLFQVDIDGKIINSSSMDALNKNIEKQSATKRLQSLSWRKVIEFTSDDDDWGYQSAWVAIDKTVGGNALSTTKNTVDIYRMVLIYVEPTDKNLAFYSIHEIASSPDKPIALTLPWISDYRELYDFNEMEKSGTLDSIRRVKSLRDRIEDIYSVAQIIRLDKELKLDERK